LVDFDNSELKRNKALEAIQNPQCGWIYTANQKDFEKIPGSPIGYWASDSFINIFDKNEQLNKKLDIKQGLATGNNLRFLRVWN
jgi:hypothetical protein